MAEAKSKGRGEECISQNLRILRGHNGKRVMLYFANSQRGALKRYVSIPRESSFFSYVAFLVSCGATRCGNGCASHILPWQFKNFTFGISI